jgi:predicted transposase YbfD/YdcC
LVDIIAIAICAVICGVDEWEDIVIYAKSKKDWFRQFLPLSGGIPSHDTFARVFALLDPTEFEKRFSEWTRDVFGKTAGDIIAIDGKTVCGSYDRTANKAAIHMVSAWSHANGVVMGQVKTADKSNEITVIPDLLQRLDIAGCIVTIDAMGCQKEIAGQIIRQGGDYVLTLKENQRGLKQEAEALFTEMTGRQFDDCRQAHKQTIDHGHGRKEIRNYWLLEDANIDGRKAEWPGLRCFGKVTTQRTVDGQVSEETRYYITSLPCRIESFAQAVRAHWGIENGLHWSLDVSFGEDDSRIRKGHAAENMSLVRRLSQSALKALQVPHDAEPRADGSYRPMPTTPFKKTSIKAKRLRCMLNQDFLLQALRTF